MKKTTLVISLLAFILALNINAEEVNNRYVLQRINGKVTLDGLSGEAAWKSIKPLPVIMQVPDFGKTPTEKTDILVAYDDDYIYAAARCFDSDAAKIQASSRKRDESAMGNEWFGIVLDTFNDKENALLFATTPKGLRLDAALINDVQGAEPYNLSWNTFWDVKTVHNENGWFVEMRIPFSSLKFQEKDGRVVMGLIVYRWIARKNELSIYPAIPFNWGAVSNLKVSRAQEVVLTGIRGHKPLYVAPYILGGHSRSYELNAEETAYNGVNDPAFEVGLDIKYGLTKNLTMDLTVNTDFAQVEADDMQVNLTRFSLFFPEKRLFFQERSSTFEFNFGDTNRLFYSRSIGIYNEMPVRIYGGVRMVGRVGNWDLGIMSMQTAAVEDNPGENFSVLRIRRQVFNPYSYVGGMVTSRLGTDGDYNIAYGLDGIFRLFGDDYLQINWAQTYDKASENKLLSLDPAQIRIGWQRRNTKGFIYDLNYNYVGENYHPGMGFQDRDNYSRFESQLKYGWWPGEQSKLLNHSAFLNGFTFLSNEDDTVESSEISAGWELATRTRFDLKIAFTRFFENITEGFSFNNNGDKNNPDVPVGEYTFYGLDVTFNNPSNRRFYYQANVYAGTFYDGRRLTLGLSPRWNVSPTLELSAVYQLNYVTFPDRDRAFTAHITRLRALAMFSTKFSISAFIQYNSSADTIATNLRIRYNPREGNDLYLVYNEGINTDRYRVEPFLPHTDNRTIMIKYTHTFKF